MAYQELTADTFNAAVDRDGITLIDFWAPWCGPCKMFGPTFEAASERHADIAFVKVNTEDQPALAQHFGIRSIPTLMAIKDRTVVFQQAGALSAGQLDQLLTALREHKVEAAE